MKTILKIAVVSTSLVLMLMADLPRLPVELVPEAEAIMGVRRRAHRRGVAVGYTAGAATATAAAASTSAAYQQQAATAPQQAAAPAPAAPSSAATPTASAVPVGTVVQALPAGCTSVVANGVNYSDCGGVFYKAAFQGNNLVYVVVENPL